jgi:hypothetical protein
MAERIHRPPTKVTEALKYTLKVCLHFFKRQSIQNALFWEPTLSGDVDSCPVELEVFDTVCIGINAAHQSLFRGSAPKTPIHI